MFLSLLLAVLSNGSPVPVDTVRLSLVAAGAFWFRWVLIACCLVAVGCAMELPETITVFKRWRFARFKDEEVEEDPKDWRIPLAAIGLIFVILGVGGETIFESLNSNAETSIREHDSAVLRLAEADAAIARQETAQLQYATQGLKTDAAKAERDMVKAQLELARLTAPIQSVPVVDGIAMPEPLKGLRLRIVLHSDVRIKLPTLSKGQSATWTLFITQDDKGNHQFATFPKNVMFGNFLFLAPHTSCTMELVTDEHGTTDLTFGGASCSRAATP